MQKNIPSQYANCIFRIKPTHQILRTNLESINIQWYSAQKDSDWLTRINLYNWHPKAEFHWKMLYMSCVCHSIIHLGFLKCNEILIAHLYIQQLQHVHQSFNKKYTARQQGKCPISQCKATYGKNYVGKNCGIHLVYSTWATIFT